MLDLVWRQEQFINQRWEEQAAIMHVLGYDSWLDPNKADALNHVHLEKVQKLSTNWNCISGLVVSDDPIIVHFAGAFREQRTSALARLAERMSDVWELPKYDRRKILFEFGCEGAAEVLDLMRKSRDNDVIRLEADVKRLQSDQLRRKADADRIMSDVNRMRSEINGILDAIYDGRDRSSLGKRLGELCDIADCTEIKAKQILEDARQQLEKYVLLLLGARREVESCGTKATELRNLAARVRASRACIVPLLALR
jgi:hypothetical protein